MGGLGAGRWRSSSSEGVWVGWSRGGKGVEQELGEVGRGWSRRIEGQGRGDEGMGE